jgi:hypothetical protein
MIRFGTAGWRYLQALFGKQINPPAQLVLAYPTSKS